MTELTEQTIIRELQDMQNRIYSKDGDQAIHDVRNGHIVIFLGNTKCGKSTLVNYAIGTRLVARRVRKRVFTIERSTGERSGPAIGSTATSETGVPTAWRLEEQGRRALGLGRQAHTTYWAVDAPGFQDNRGVAQDIANAFHIKRLLSVASSVRFVVVSDIKDITSDNINPFIYLIDTLHAMLPQTVDVLGSTTLLFNKVQDDITPTEIANILKEELLQNFSVKIKNRDFVRYFVDNVQQIGVVNMPKSENMDTNFVFGNIAGIIRNIKELQGSKLTEISPGISDKSRVFLLVAHNRLSEWAELDALLTAALWEFAGNLSKCEQLKTSTSTPEQIQDVRAVLVRLRQQLGEIEDATLSSRDALLKLASLLPGPTGDTLKNDKSILTKLDLITFVDQLLGIDKSAIFRIKFVHIVTLMVEKINQCHILVQDKTLEISKEEASRRYAQITEEHALHSAEMRRRLEEVERSSVQARAQVEQEQPDALDMFDKMANVFIKVVTAIKGAQNQGDS